MPLIHHVVTGQGHPPVVFVHGFGCAHSDWDAQVVHFAPRHLTVTVDLRGHGASPGTPDECSLKRYGADVAAVMQTLALPPAILIGHSMGCRVVVEAAMQATANVAGVVLVDGSQFASAMEATLKETFATPGGFSTFVARWFREMFTTKSNPASVAAVVERAGRPPRAIGEKVLLDAVRYDTGRLATSLCNLRVPVMAIQTTYSNERCKRRSMSESLRTWRCSERTFRRYASRPCPTPTHFPQIDEPLQTNALIDSFIARLPARLASIPDCT